MLAWSWAEDLLYGLDKSETLIAENLDTEHPNLLFEDTLVLFDFVELQRRIEDPCDHLLAVVQRSFGVGYVGLHYALRLLLTKMRFAFDCLHQEG